METPDLVNEEGADAADGAFVERALGDLRRRLLDTSKRNPLTHTNIEAQRGKQIRIVEELSDEIFRLLYREQKAFSFQPGEEQPDDGEDLDDDEDAEPVYVPEELSREPEARHLDTKLQTELGPADLQKKLLALFREARSIEEDLSINVLYLALGFLLYYDAESSDLPRYAPLVLLPVSLSRSDSRGVFKLTVRDEDLTSNQSLRLMLAEEHGISLPEFPDSEDWTPSAYFEFVRNAVSGKPRFSVLPDHMVLRFFSFEKLMMSRDLEGEALAQFQASNSASFQMVHQLLGGNAGASIGIGRERGLSVAEARENLDQRYDDPRELNHILDADTSQTEVIAAAKDGQSLVVQGPPGTGKSQTITNIIGTAVAQGKTVLFMAEKKAALDVVYRRLQNCGLGHLCLELHSQKATRKHFYEDLKRTLDAVEARPVDSGLYEGVREVRDQLNHMTGLLHTIDETTGNTPHLLMGRMAELGGKGVPPPTFRVAGIEQWSKDDFERRLNTLAAVAELIRSYGPASAQPWRGTGRRLSLPDQERLRRFIDDHAASTRTLCAAIEEAEDWNPHKWPKTPANVARSIDAQQFLLARREMVAECAQKETVTRYRGDLFRLFSDLDASQALERELEESVVPSAFDLDWSLDSNVIRQRGRSFWRFLDSSYRKALGRLKAVSRTGLPKSFEGRTALLDRLLECGAAQQKIETQAELGRAHFGLAWAGRKTEFEDGREAVQWIDDNESFFGSLEALGQALERFGGDAEVSERIDAVRQALEAWKASWQEIAGLLDLDVEKAFGVADSVGLDADEIFRRTQEWLASFDQLEPHHRLVTANRELDDSGLGEVVRRLDDGKLDPEVAVDSVMLHRCETVLKSMQDRYPELETISGRERSKLVERFRTQDQQLKQLAAQEIVFEHDQRLPRGNLGEMGLIRGEVNKKTRHMPIRRLLDSAGDAMAWIKPVFLMSPLSVSRFLPPDGLKFDMLLIDEASQVRPEEAFGGIMRARQIIVVGDSKQLPPTSFFQREVSGDDEMDEEDDSLETMQLRQTADMESVLSLCDARGLSNTMLRWHYRSEHPSLIEVSNHEFYDDRLVYPPPPNFGKGRSGLQFVNVDGTYDRGRRRNNEKEAETVCAYIHEHVRNYPGQSLGVVALSSSQRNTIQDKVDTYCREHSEIEHFCNADSAEPFFVKNLENVQGDERDVIYVSIGYGPDKDGVFFQNLGPVSGEHGARRLNVLFTRARKQCVIFASITHNSIREDAARSSGASVLKKFLRYAETGEIDVPFVTGGDFDSPFEADVARVLRDRNFKVETQVGSAGFRIDLAVHDPDQEGHFLLAVECDGAAYHSASWARERDRLRQEVLEGKGWTFHRIWSTDWFYNREAEITKLLNAIDAARARQTDFRTAGRPAADPPPEPAPAPVPDQASAGTDEAASRSEPPEIAAEPYQEADFEIASADRFEIHEASEKSLASALRQILRVEAPIHIDVLAARLTRLWGKKRTGGRITDAVTAMVEKMVIDGRAAKVSGARDFYQLAQNRPAAAIRDRSEVSLSLLKKPEYVPPEEICAVVERLVVANVALSEEQCAREAIKVLGVTRQRDGMQTLVRAAARTLAASGLIEQDGEMLRRK